MTKMSKEVLEFVKKTKPAYLATASKEGVPNISPKGSMMVMDEETLIFASLFPGKTSQNIAENKHVSIAYVDPATFRGYQLKGEAQILRSGKVYDDVCDKIAASPMKLPKPEAAVVIKLKDIYDLSPGPGAGKKV